MYLLTWSEKLFLSILDYVIKCVIYGLCSRRPSVEGIRDSNRAIRYFSPNLCMNGVCVCACVRVCVRVCVHACI